MGSGLYITQDFTKALYHRDYREREPVEITIEPTHIDILSYAGPDRSISAEALREAKKLKARRYRNRRLGDFLKELDLTEGRATGIPTIQRHLKLNGNAPATIDTDDDRTYFLMTIPCREDFVVDVVHDNAIDNIESLNGLKQVLGQAFVQVQEIINQSVICDKIQLGQVLEQMFVQVWAKSKGEPDVIKLCIAMVDTLCLLSDNKLSANTLNSALGYGRLYELKRKIIIPLLDLGYIIMTNPDKPTSSKQEYKLTEKGQTLFYA